MVYKIGCTFGGLSSEMIEHGEEGWAEGCFSFRAANTVLLPELVVTQSSTCNTLPPSLSHNNLIASFTEDANCSDVWWVSKVLKIYTLVNSIHKIESIELLSNNKGNYKETTRWFKFNYKCCSCPFSKCWRFQNEDLSNEDSVKFTGQILMIQQAQ